MMLESPVLDPRFSVIVPAHNEEARIGGTLDTLAAAFGDSEVIVVLNGCSDDTRGVVDRVRVAYENIRVLEIPDALGKGGAVRAGFLVAQADVVCYVDADGSTPAAEMRRLCEALGPFDGLIGSRWLPGSHVIVKQPLKRRIASRSFNVLVRLLFGLRYSDTQCGAKVFRKSALERVMGDVETANLAFDVDLLFAMKNRGLPVKEVPTYWVDVAGSKIALLSASLRMLAALLRLRLGHSIVRLIVPFFDRVFPTSPVPLRERLRILILNWRDPKHPQAGGAETYLFEQARRWAEWGHHVEWLTASFPGAPSSETLDGVRVRRVGNAMTVYFVLPLTYLREFRDRFDVVLDSENGIPFFSPLFSMKPKVCIVYHVHREVFRKHLPAWLAYPLMWCEEKFMPLVYRNSRFVTIADDTCAEMKRLRMSKRAIGLVRSGVDEALRPGRKAADPTVLYFGRLKNYKRVNLLIDAFARVKAAVPSAVLRIAGTGDARPSLEAQVRRMGLTQDVLFEGFVDDARKLALLQEAWVAVSPSEMEGWGISTIEANACATPAVAFSVPGLREAIVHDRSGLLVPEGGDLAPSIVSILTDRTLRERLERGARERAGAFSWDTCASEMLVELMRAIVGGEFRVVDIGGQWAFLGAESGGARHMLSRRALSETFAASMKAGPS